MIFCLAEQHGVVLPRTESLAGRIVSLAITEDAVGVAPASSIVTSVKLDRLVRIGQAVMALDTTECTLTVRSGGRIQRCSASVKSSAADSEHTPHPFSHT